MTSASRSNAAIGLLALAALGLAGAASPAVSDEAAHRFQSGSEAPVAGNPAGDVTIVAFLDYNCPYCRHLTPALAKIMAGDPKVRVVFRDWPVLSANSVEEARLASAAQYQGKYLQAHRALMALKGPYAPRPAIRDALKAADIDLGRLDADLATHGREIDALLDRNLTQAEAHGFRSVPGFVIGSQVIGHELDEDGFRKAVAAARAQRAATSDR